MPTPAFSHPSLMGRGWCPAVRPASRAIASLLAAIALLVACGRDAHAQAAPALAPSATWHDGSIGDATAASHTWDGHTLTVTGSGAGINVKGADSAAYRYFTRPAGDFQIVARLASFTGTGDATAGIMARASVAPDSVMVALSVRAKGNALGWTSRNPAASPAGLPQMDGGGIQLAGPPPIWLKIVRMGDNFAVYKSHDGNLWTIISNVSGGPIAFDGPVEIGFYVTSDAGGQPVTASFDSIAAGPARMPYHTGWVGNSFDSHHGDVHVSNNLSAMWVAPDGTCYTSSYWDEGGRPVTSYKDGHVGRALPIGTPCTAEGGITGDNAGHVIVATNDKVTVLDPSKPDFAPRPISLAVNMMDKTSGNCMISGLASNGSEIFVADARDNRVRVVTMGDVPTYQVAMAANDGVGSAPAPVVVPTGDPNYAPAIIYQTQRLGEGDRYTIPGFKPGAKVTIRCHFAEFSERPVQWHNVTVNGVQVNVEQLAGGILKAAYKDLPNQAADAKGSVTLDFGGYGGGGICGFEILDPATGKRLFAVNCGGPTVGDWKGESPELVDREFDFVRPGPMAIDSRGDLWIIQRGNDYPIGGATTAKYPAAVKCYSTDGKFTGREIDDVVNPRALGYDFRGDRLLVGENGPDMNVRIYTGLDSKPVLAGTLGVKGGIYAGPHPGLVCDPDDGGYARFDGIAGVGVDTSGNIYVGGGLQGTDLRMFTPGGHMGWMLDSLMFCNTYDFDSATDGNDLYGTYNHLRLDSGEGAKAAAATPEPWRGGTFIGYNWDERKYGQPDRAGGAQAIVRRLGPDDRLVLYNSGQGTVGDIGIYRYDGEIAIPCGRITASTVWIDANGDGKQTPDEITTMPSQIGWVTCFCVDQRGDIWAAEPSTGGSFMRHFKFLGFNSHGVPLYSGVKGTGYEDVPFPEEGGTTNAWGMTCKLGYDADRDIMVCFYPCVARTGEKDTTPPQYMLARYDNWSKGNRKPTWKEKGLTPYTDPAYFMYEANLYPYSTYEGFQMCGDYIFFAYLFGEVHVFSLATGKLVQILSPGPEVDGQDAWEDAAMGLRAWKTKSGEYLVVTENSGWGGKNNFFRWRP